MRRATICTCQRPGGLCKTCRPIRARLARANPACVFCGQQCGGGQQAVDGRPCHYVCALVRISRDAP